MHSNPNTPLCKEQSILHTNLILEGGAQCRGWGDEEEWQRITMESLKQLETYSDQAKNSFRHCLGESQFSIGFF